MEHLNWGLPVAIDLFAAGIGAAAFMIAVVADMAGGKKYTAVSMTGALIAPWPALLGVLLLVLDLGRPLRFWEMVLRKGEGFLMFNPGSTMSLGTWILSLFVVLSLLYIVVRVVALAMPSAEKLARLVGIVGLVLALLTATYTGVLISATSNALWHSVLLPFVFVASALVTGMALVIFVLAVLKALNLTEVEGTLLAKLEKICSMMIIVQLAAMVLFIIVGLGSSSMLAIIGWPFGLLFWILIVGLGLVVPLLSGLKKEVRAVKVSVLMSLLILLGGFLLRYVILLAGQIT
jgi:polysulfide reductase chain C